MIEDDESTDRSEGYMAVLLLAQWGGRIIAGALVLTGAVVLWEVLPYLV